MTRRLLLLIAATLAFFVAYRTGAFALLRDVEALRASASAAGAWAPITFVLSYAVFQGLGAPAAVFVIAAVVIWPKPMAFGLCFSGAMGAAVIGFAFARYVAREWVSTRLPPLLVRFDQRIGQNGLLASFLVRLFFFLAAPAHWVLGLSRVSWPPYLLGSFFGFVPGLLASVFVGGSLLAWARSSPVPAAAGLCALLLLALLAALLLRSRSVRTPLSADR